MSLKCDSPVFANHDLTKNLNLLYCYLNEDWRVLSIHGIVHSNEAGKDRI